MKYLLMMNNIIRVLITDDHQMLIDGIRSLLRNEKGIEIVGEAHRGEEALETLKNIRPDLLITDVNMPGMSGIELTRIVKERFPSVRILVLTMYNDAQNINEILMAEAEGYILKNTGKEELIAAIRKIADHGTYYCNEVISILKSELKTEKAEVEPADSLTTREREILKLICHEHSSAEIAEKLFISHHTVDTHRKNILHKTNSKTIVGLIRYAINQKYFD